jgi:hypothetical protein
MARWPLRLFLLVAVIFSSIGMVSCSLPFFGSSQSSGDTAAFQIIDFLLDDNDVFVIAQDSILLTKDAVKLVTTITASQSPPANTQSDHIQVSILYNKQGVESQDVYSIDTGKASLGIFLQGGETFESFAANSVDIDATHTNKITIVPLQKATSEFTVSAAKGWQNTGIFLERGKTFEVKYLSGTWTIAKGVFGTSDAAGQPVNPPRSLLCHCGEPLAGFSTQALVGRIGGGVGFTPLQVGDDFSGVAYDNEFLYLRINLPDQLLSYASGAVTVSIGTNNS